MLELLGTAVWEYDLWTNSPGDRGPSLVLFDERTSHWAHRNQDAIVTALEGVTLHLTQGPGLSD